MVSESVMKFEPFRRCEKALKKLRVKFEKSLGKIISTQLHGESHKRAKRRLTYSTKSRYISREVRYDRPSLNEMVKKPPGTPDPSYGASQEGNCLEAMEGTRKIDLVDIFPGDRTEAEKDEDENEEKLDVEAC